MQLTGDEKLYHPFTPHTKQVEMEFGSLKQHVRGHRFYNNEEVEMHLRNWMRMQDPEFYGHRFFKSCQGKKNVQECSGVSYDQK